MACACRPTSARMGQSVAKCNIEDAPPEDPVAKVVTDYASTASPAACWDQPSVFCPPTLNGGACHPRGVSPCENFGPVSATAVCVRRAPVQLQAVPGGNITVSAGNLTPAQLLAESPLATAGGAMEERAFSDAVSGQALEVRKCCVGPQELIAVGGTLPMTFRCTNGTLLEVTFSCRPIGFTFYRSVPIRVEFARGPSLEAGIERGMVLEAIDRESLSNMSFAEALKIIVSKCEGLPVQKGVSYFRRAVWPPPPEGAVARRDLVVATERDFASPQP